MNISSETHLAAVVLRLEGEFTIDEVDHFRRDVKESMETSNAHYIIDCEALTLIDSVGLESFLWLSEELSKSGNKLRFANVSQTVSCVFELTRLDRVFNVHDCVESAARSVG